MAKYFAYLDALRESGATNMFGAARYVKDEFGLSAREAKDVLVAWMRTYDPDKTPEERARGMQ